jgi:hypothetical protein
MTDQFSTRQDIADRHRRLFDLLKTGDLMANPLDSLSPDQDAVMARDMRGGTSPSENVDLSAIQRIAIDSLLRRD